MTDEELQVLEAAMALPEVERARLAFVLRDSIGDGSSQEEIDAAVLEEVKRRRDNLRSGRTKPVPYEEVRRKLDAMIERGRGQRPPRAEHAAGADARGRGRH